MTLINKDPSNGNDNCFFFLGHSIHNASFKVFFIDEGFFGMVNANDLRPLEKKYASMQPSQSFHCVLGGVQPMAALNQREILGFGK